MQGACSRGCMHEVWVAERSCTREKQTFELTFCFYTEIRFFCCDCMDVSHASSGGGVNDTRNAIPAAVYFVGIIPAFAVGWFIHDILQSGAVREGATTHQPTNQPTNQKARGWSGNFLTAC